MKVPSHIITKAVMEEMTLGDVLACVRWRCGLIRVNTTQSKGVGFTQHMGSYQRYEVTNGELVLWIDDNQKPDLKFNLESKIKIKKDHIELDYGEDWQAKLEFVEQKNIKIADLFLHYE